jgi:hypothetical protein
LPIRLLCWHDDTGTKRRQLTPSYREAVNDDVVSNTGGSYDGGTFPTPATPGPTWAISGLTFIRDVTVTGNGQTANAFEEFCLNAASTSGCPLADNGQIEVYFSKRSAVVVGFAFFSRS